MSDIKILKAGQTGDSELNMVYIYMLIDPVTNLVRYIGKADNIQIRLKEHIGKSKYTKTHKNNWINSLLEKDLKPIVEVIDMVSDNEWGFWEQFWIDQFKNWGFNLTNMANGGRGGNLGPIVNKKISIKLKGKVCSDETKDKLRYFRLGKSYEELYGLENAKIIKNNMSKVRANTGNSMYGKRHTEETKNKIKIKLSVTNKGENNPMYGKKHTEETKKNMCKKVMQISLDGELIKIWGSITEAAEALNINQSGISNVCNKDNRTYYKYKWKKK